MSVLVTVWAVLTSIFTGGALFRFARAPKVEAPIRTRRRPHVVLIRPVDAPTALELANLATPIDYPGQLTHVVVSPFRPRLESANVRWLASDPLSKNRKVGHIAYALATMRLEAQHAVEQQTGAAGDDELEPMTATTDQVVLCVDADVRVDAALITALVDELRDGAALASAAPRPEVLATTPGRCVRGLLVQSHHAFEVLDIMSTSGARAVCGKAIALSPVALDELVKLADCIGEDLELSHVLHQRGLPVTLAKAPARMPQAPLVTLSAVVDRFTRWMQVLRAHRPWLFPSIPLLFAPTPMLMVLASVLASPVLALVLCLHVGLRITLANRQDDGGGLRFEWLMAEVLLLVCWGNALWQGQTVEWRGRRFSLKAKGRMEAAPAIEEAR